MDSGSVLGFFLKPDLLRSYVKEICYFPLSFRIYQKKSMWLEEVVFEMDVKLQWEVNVCGQVRGAQNQTRFSVLT